MSTHRAAGGFAPRALARGRRLLERLAEPLPGEAASDVPVLWSEMECQGVRVLRATGEFWTARQRQASPLHEIAYRACYKPQLPRHFIVHLTDPGQRVFDPFSGRGTTALEAALLGRRVASNDINPLSRILTEPRLTPPALEAVRARLAQLPRHFEGPREPDLSMFYAAETEAEVRALRRRLMASEATGEMDAVDRWIRMVATNRLTGHSPGFFSVYSLPPNQAALPHHQVRINTQRHQVPPYRDVHALILKKSHQLTKDLLEPAWTHLARAAADALWLTGDARDLSELPDASVHLTVTSPPFLDVVQYASDNWLRCWFCGLDADAIGRGITMARTVAAWSEVMGEVFRELHRVTVAGGHVAFEVGEVRGGSVRLEEVVLPLGMAAGFDPIGILVNRQSFTKTAHIWGVDNNDKGTNSNRIVIFQRA